MLRACAAQTKATSADSAVARFIVKGKATARLAVTLFLTL